MDREPILVVSDLSKNFGALKAIDGISFEVRPMEVFGIAGPNGSGKSTLFNAITHIPFLQSSGVVMLEGRKISGLASNEIAKLGLARTFQRESVFSNLSAIDNILVTIEQNRRASKFSQKVALAEQVMDIVGFPATLQNCKAGVLPVFFRKLIMIAGAIALDPVVLLLDEPASGLTVDEIERIRLIILKLQRIGITILLIEHVLSLLMAVSDRLMVLDQGKIIALGEPSEVVKVPAVIEAYLGVTSS